MRQNISTPVCLDTCIYMYKFYKGILRVVSFGVVLVWNMLAGLGFVVREPTCSAAHSTDPLTRSLGGAAFVQYSILHGLCLPAGAHLVQTKVYSWLVPCSG